MVENMTQQSQEPTGITDSLFTSFTIQLTYQVSLRHVKQSLFALLVGFVWLHGERMQAKEEEKYVCASLNNGYDDDDDDDDDDASTSTST